MTSRKGDQHAREQRISRRDERVFTFVYLGRATGSSSRGRRAVFLHASHLVRLIGRQRRRCG